MRVWRFTAWIVIAALVIPAAGTSSQGVADVCPQIVSDALAMTHELCASTRRNQACYGHVEIEADPQPGVGDLHFDEEGDITDLENLRSLRLSPMDLETMAWGVSLLRLQANLPDSSPGQNVTLITFGDVTLENAAQGVVQLPVRAEAHVNVRRTPDTERNNVLVALEPGETVMATGRLADGSWLRVLLPEGGDSGWVYADLVTSAHDLSTLDVVPAGQSYYRPYQAFYFRSAVDDSLCPEAAESGLLIQTPAGVGRVRFLVNEVAISLGSTAFLQAQPGDMLTVSVLEGEAQVTAQGITQNVLPGTSVSVALDAHLLPSAPPAPLQPYQAAVVDSLPLTELERPVEPPEPMSVEAINQIATVQATPLASLIPAPDIVQTDRAHLTPMLTLEALSVGTLLPGTLTREPAALETLDTMPVPITAQPLPTAPPTSPVVVPTPIEATPVPVEPLPQDPIKTPPPAAPVMP